MSLNKRYRKSRQMKKPICINRCSSFTTKLISKKALESDQDPIHFLVMTIVVAKIQALIKTQMELNKA
jgi:hypothetical protein